MQSAQNVRFALRAATAEHHARVDALYSGFDLADRSTYGRFLVTQARAQLATEDALTRAGVAAVMPDWPARQRAGRLRADLAALYLAVPETQGSIAFDCPASVLGGLYVLEGSRLGGRVLRRRVPADFPCTFLDAPDPASWRRLLATLEERLIEDRQCERAIAAAVAVFTLFESSGKAHLRDGRLVPAA